jgi:hypothetical protein
MIAMRQTQEITKACATIPALERRKDVTRILSSQHPESTLTLSFHNIGSPDQVAIAKPTVLVFALMAKNHADASASLDGNAAKVSGDWLIEALRLGFNDSREVKVGVAFTVEIYIKSVEHNCLPFAVRMALPGIRHGTICAVVAQNSW